MNSTNPIHLSALCTGGTYPRAHTLSLLDCLCAPSPEPRVRSDYSLAQRKHRWTLSLPRLLKRPHQQQHNMSRSCPYEGGCEEASPSSNQITCKYRGSNPARRAHTRSLLSIHVPMALSTQILTTPFGARQMCLGLLHPATPVQSRKAHRMVSRAYVLHNFDTKTKKKKKKKKNRGLLPSNGLPSAFLFSRNTAAVEFLLV